MPSAGKYRPHLGLVVIGASVFFGFAVKEISEFYSNISDKSR